MDKKQVDLVKETFERIIPIKNDFVNDFYGELFRIAPNVRALFPEDMSKQKEKLVSTLTFVIASLHNPAMIIKAIEELGKRHLDYKTKKEHYDYVGEAIIFALSKNLGQSFNAEVRAAWVEAYNMIADIMKKAAYKN